MHRLDYGSRGRFPPRLDRRRSLRSCSAPLLPFIALLLVVTASGTAWADGPQTGVLDGRVLDVDGKPLVGVSVRLSSSRGESTVQTDPTGLYRFTQLAADDYVLTAELEGMRPIEVRTRLATGERRSQDLVLGLETGETITVSGEAALVNKYQVGTVASLPAEVAQEVTFRNRNYQAQLETLPGVVDNRESRVAGNFEPALNGGQWQEVASFIEGVDTSFPRKGGRGLILPGSAVMEVMIEGSGYGAEYGRATHGVNNVVIREGNNAFHGEFLYIPQNAEWRAETKPIAVPRPDDWIHSYEVALGGPIARDRAWFFVSASEIDANEVDLLGDTGQPIDIGFKSDPKIAKITAQPAERHGLRGVYVDAPLKKTLVDFPTRDPVAPCDCALSGELGSLGWSWTVTSRQLLEVKVGRETAGEFANALPGRPIDPQAPPESPGTNNFGYWDLNDGFRYNFIGQPFGDFFIETTREQANVAHSSFLGNHELKLGIDYQDITFDTQSRIGTRFNGRAYDPSRAGGFVTPVNKQVFVPAGVITTTMEVASVYVQDRVEVGSRWTLTGGLRLDDQVQHNDIGEKALSSTDLAPRLSAVYDARGEGRLLVKATVGRYYQAVAMDVVSREFSRLPTGNNIFDEFLWNPLTQRYDIFSRRSSSIPNNQIQAIDPYYKDEYTLGVDWQLTGLWVLSARAIYWDMGDLWWASNQYDANGAVVRTVRNWTGEDFRGFRNYRGLQLQANRAFRGGWALQSNYTLSRNHGNTFGFNIGRLEADDLFEALGGLQVGTGRTDTTIVNREGRGDTDRTHILNITGLKTWSLGEHDISAGAYFGFRSGERYAVVANTAVAHPISRTVLQTRIYTEPRDAQQLDDFVSLNLTGTWNIPIRNQWRGLVRVEVANVFDEQVLLFINPSNGRPFPGAVFSYQSPREYRLNLGVRF